MLPSGCIRSGLRTRDEKPDRSTGTALTRTLLSSASSNFPTASGADAMAVLAVLFLDRYDEATPWFQRSLAANPSNGVGASLRSDILAARTAALALGDHTEEARADAGEVIRLWPTLTARSYYLAKLTSPVAVAQVAVCAMDCGKPAYAITPTRTPISMCHRIRCCIPITKLTRRRLCRVLAPLGRMTWPSCWKSVSGAPPPFRI